jgi:hypothetical protein
LLRIASLVVVLLASPARDLAAQERGSRRFTPPSNLFACDLPGDDWHAFEEEEASGFATHILGPDNPAGTYRTGIDIRWVEKGQAGWKPLKQAIDDLRRGNKDTDRGSTNVRPYRISGILARTFEISETRRLPADQAPSLEDEIHHYVAVIPSGESYYIIKLSSTRDVYLEYRELFVRFLRSFKPLGYK